MDTTAIRAAKDALRAKYAAHAWFRGVGIVPRGDGLALRLNVDPESKPDPGELPGTFEGIPVVIVYIGAYAPR